MDARARFEALAPGLVEPLRRFLARRIDPDTAEDVLAETLLVCWRRIEELPDDPLPWAYAVARRTLANAQRSARRQDRVRSRLAGSREAQPEGTPGPTGAAEVALAEALDALRPDDAEVLRLWAWEQLTPAEIAVVLELTPNAAAVRLHRARTRLRTAVLDSTGNRSGAAGKNPDPSGHERSRGGKA